MDSSLTKKTGVVYLDLTAAYDAVWHLGLLQTADIHSCNKQ